MLPHQTLGPLAALLLLACPQLPAQRSSDTATPRPDAGPADVETRRATDGLTRQQAETLLRERFARACAAKRPAAEEALEAQVVRAAGQELKLLERTFGEAPENGRSLWISMHGGGGTTAKTNDGQWHNQIRLYEPDEGIVVAPRAPTNTWNLWHQGHIDPLFDELIATYVAARGVDPDRIYLMGYSAGGDGVYQLAPRMADRFAAASMMAGHPNETRPDALRNLPFLIFMGGKDGAYDRNAIAARWKDELAALQEADPDGYPHRVTIYPEFGHWMNRRDAEALPWMAARTRSAWPRRVVWLQDDVTHARFYWLELPESEVRARRRIVAEVEGQSIRITADADLGALTLRLRDTLLDLDRPVTVLVNDEPVYEGPAPRTEAAIQTSLDERLDPGTAATARLELRW